MKSASKRGSDCGKKAKVVILIKEFTVRSTKRNEIIDITKQVSEAVKGVREGIAMVYTPHATAAVIINENYDPSVCDDILDALSMLFPQGKWKHDRVDANADAHIKSAVCGPSEQVIVRKGKPLLGQWQGIALADFDGPRERKVLVKISEV